MVSVDQAIFRQVGHSLGIQEKKKTYGVNCQISSCSFIEGTKELIKITRLVVQKFNRGERRLTDSLPEADLDSGLWMESAKPLQIP